MKLDFSFDTHKQLWIDGALPPAIKQGKDRKVKVQLVDAKSVSPFPHVFSIGDLLPGERPSPLQHEVTLLLTYPHSITPSPAVQDEDGWWTVPGSQVYGQIRVPLSAEAI